MADKRGPRICQENKSDGQKCKARAIFGSKYCFFHDPAKAEARKSAQRAGGIARSGGGREVMDEASDFPLETAADGIVLLGEVANRMLRGKLDPKEATAIGYVVNIFFKGLSLHSFESRLRVLEEIKADRSSVLEVRSAQEDAQKFEFEYAPEEDDDECGG